MYTKYMYSVISLLVWNESIVENLRLRPIKRRIAGESIVLASGRYVADGGSSLSLGASARSAVKLINNTFLIRVVGV